MMVGRCVGCPIFFANNSRITAKRTFGGNFAEVVDGGYCVVVADAAVTALQFSGKGLTGAREVAFELLPLSGRRESTS
ncbi:MAG TPA: hypothetical protein DIT01_11285 [Lentisphaeria bacterium]|nr:hypothetical protein [Lentisphaeria bacterium]|tara:strand:- start:503 stop:736 length:234 start_codon:yes stop_codon:yes gene_type:complete